jgi:hypothetical protein
MVDFSYERVGQNQIKIIDIRDDRITVNRTQAKICLGGRRRG